MASNRNLRARRKGRRMAALVSAAVGVSAVVAVGVGATPSAASDSYEKMTTFECLGVPQDFVVPKGVTSIYASVTGASGGGDRGGKGGEVISTIKVTPGELLTVTVGCRESAAPSNSTHGGGYGYAAGGDGGAGHFQTGAPSGGGASAVQIGGVNVVVAGGGGGQGADNIGDGGSGGDAGVSGGTAGDGPSGGDGGVLGGSTKAAGATGLEGSGRSGGGGGGGFPKGGGGGGAGKFAGFGGGGGGGGENYVDGNPDRITGVVTTLGERNEQGSVVFHYEGGADASPEIFSCTGSMQSYSPWPGQTGIRVTAIGANGNAKSPDGHTMPTKPGLGEAVSAVIPVRPGLTMDVGVGCTGSPGQWGGAGTDRSPGGNGGFGLFAGGAGGQGYRSILDPRGEGGGAGGSGGGGASGVRDSDMAETLLVGAGGGGGGGWGEPTLGWKLSGGDGGNGGKTAGESSEGIGWASGGPLGGAPSWPGAPGGTSPDGSLAGGGGGGGGGFTNGGAGGNAGGFGGAGGGGGGGGLSYTDSPRVSDGQVVNAKGYRGLGHTDGIVIITPVFG